MKNKKNNRKIAIAVIIIILLVLTFIFYKKEVNNTNLKEITIRLKYFHQSQFSGVYVAQENGYFKERGLKVNIEQYIPEESSMDALINGKVDIIITSTYELIKAREKGLPVKAFGVKYQKNPISLYSLKNMNINIPYDLVGKKVGIEKSYDIERAYMSLIKKLNINRSLIKEVQIGWEGKEILNRTVDVATGYFMNEPYYLIKEGEEVNIILLEDWGIIDYSDILVVREETIKNNPEIPENFLKAVIKGWKYSIKNQKDSVKTTLKYSKHLGRNEDNELYMLQNTAELMLFKDAPILWMEKQRWEEIYNRLLENGEITKPFNIEEAYTMEFLNKVYGKNN